MFSFFRKRGARSGTGLRFPHWSGPTQVSTPLEPWGGWASTAPPLPTAPDATAPASASFAWRADGAVAGRGRRAKNRRRGCRAAGAPSRELARPPAQRPAQDRSSNIATYSPARASTRRCTRSREAALLMADAGVKGHRVPAPGPNWSVKEHNTDPSQVKPLADALTEKPPALLQRPGDRHPPIHGATMAGGHTAQDHRIGKLTRHHLVDARAYTVGADTFAPPPASSWDIMDRKPGGDHQLAGDLAAVSRCGERRKGAYATW